MQALVTRPADDAVALAAALTARGIAPVLAPLIAIRRLAVPVPDLAGVQALLFTSANGVRAFAAASRRRDLPVLAVGDATAQAAAAAGFGDVASAGGDAADLARLVIARRDPAAGALLHIAGSAVAGDLAGRLAGAGFTLGRAVLYAAEPVAALAPAIAAALAAGAIELAFFFSPRTAARFVTLAGAAGIGLACRRLTGFCLSPAVAEALAPLAIGRVITAAAPTRAELFAALDVFLAGRRGGVGAIEE